MQSAEIQPINRPPPPPSHRCHHYHPPPPSSSSEDEDFTTSSGSSSAVVIGESDQEDNDVNQPPPLLPPNSPQVKGRSCNKEKEKRGTLMWETWAAEDEKWLDAFEEERSDPGEPAVPDAVEPSPDVLLPLLRFQKEWLSWALKQEDSETRGGILADEMGMGKTIQAISLVLTSRYLRSRSVGGAVNSGIPSSSATLLPRTKCTLVVCPVVAVIQWVGEIERHTQKGSVKVLVFHGAKRLNANYNFNDYDFVLTTYSTIESDYRKNILPPKKMCQYCQKKFYPPQMRVHLKYYCGPSAMKTDKQAKQVSKKKKNLMGKKQVELLDFFKEDGRGKKKDEQGDDAIGSTSVKSALHSVRWERIILDEAHFIKDRRCNTAKAIFALESEYKWALSGTPLQNRVGELYSLLRFLQIFPYSFYFCKNCDCRVLDRCLKECSNCSHSCVRHFCWWNKYITKPIQDSSMLDDGKRAMILMKHRVLKSIVLRRTKKGRAADIALPPRIVTLRRDSLDKAEQEFYEALYTQSRIKFDSYLSAGTLMNNYAHIFELLTRLRQAVDHPYLVMYGNRDDSKKDSCGICHNPADDMVVTSCKHFFCKGCLIDYSASLGCISCPTCSKPLTVDLTTKNSGELVSGVARKGFKRSGILDILNILDFKTSTKIDALREEIRNMVENDGSAKGIVFSQFTLFLDLINFSLQKSGIKCVQLVGSMSLPEREKAIRTFTDDVDCKVFLMSLKAGGVALNLTVASHVFLMDPWWNPAVEKQAQDRIHRIGQYKPIRSVRFVIEDTIEERILKLQEKKQLLFEGTVGDSAEAMARLTEGDLRFLFQN
ncbi:DNA repair protein RAD16 [Typha angustifolia]|uniref:DNA repair protein RAD16 n=1 Tax=Typha angustifolia TaxID=59011 RepID=UPI003C2FC50A